MYFGTRFPSSLLLRQVRMRRLMILFEMYDVCMKTDVGARRTVMLATASVERNSGRVSSQDFTGSQLKWRLDGV